MCFLTCSLITRAGSPVSFFRLSSVHPYKMTDFRTFIILFIMLLVSWQCVYNIGLYPVVFIPGYKWNPVALWYIINYNCSSYAVTYGILWIIIDAHISGNICSHRRTLSNIMHLLLRIRIVEIRCRKCSSLRIVILTIAYLYWPTMT